MSTTANEGGQQPGALAQSEAATPAETSAYTPHAEMTTAPLTAGAHLYLGMDIGRYRILKTLGEGGMGTVYLAEQSEPIKRQVALKVVRGGVDSWKVIARFEAERQALAVMDHPHIARIYDGGTTASQQPYFVMELVEGVPITEYCDQRRMSLEQRLELFVMICQAVQHAHQKGIIHRDLKPSNVLVTEVDGKPIPKVIDFGVAKAIGEPLTDQSFGETGAIVGTPTYMSPEQADPSLDVDTRTDVYSLGVMLYELVTGALPIDVSSFKRGALLEVLRMLREVEPPRPSTRLSMAPNLAAIASNRSIETGRLTKTLQGELEWVIMKALEKDRSRRYETALSLGQDIQRYLNHEVVEARPASRLYRFKKFVKRHRGTVIAASLLFVSLVGGLIGTLVGLWEANQQKNSAMAGWGKAQIEQERAERQFKIARSLVFDMGNQINQLETSRNNPKAADVVRKQALDEARKQFDQFRASQPDDLQVQLQAALLHRYGANVSRSLSDFPEAKAAYDSSVSILEDLVQRNPEAWDYRDKLAQTLVDKALLEWRLGKLPAAAQTLDRAYSIAEVTKGRIDESNWRRTVGRIELERASIAYQRGQFEAAERFAAHARQHFQEMQALTKINPAIKQQSFDPLMLVMAVNLTAIIQRERGQHVTAQQAHEEALKQSKALVKADANQNHLYWDCEVRRELAKTASATPERLQSMATDLREVIRVLDKLVEDYPYLAYYREKLAATLTLRSELLLKLNQVEPATADLARSLAVSRELIDRYGGVSASLLVRGDAFLAQGRIHAQSGKKDAAEASWKNAAKVFEMALTIDPDNFHHRRGAKVVEEERQRLKK